MERLILEHISEKLKNGESAAMASITEICGSSPGRKGAVMAIFEDGSTFGTIGGGRLEYEVIKQSSSCLNSKESDTFCHKLNDRGELDMQCGGEVRGFIKVFAPKAKLVIVGGGHIALHLHRLSSVIGLETVVIDDREEFANKSRFESADRIILDSPDHALKSMSMDKNTYIVIVSRGYKDDATALESVIDSNAGYIGMIGSRGKITYILKNMVEKGVDRERLKKLYTPIGLDIATEKPEEIALGILSEIVLIKNNRTLSHMRDVVKIEI